MYFFDSLCIDLHFSYVCIFMYSLPWIYGHICIFYKGRDSYEIPFSGVTGFSYVEDIAKIFVGYVLMIE